MSKVRALQSLGLLALLLLGLSTPVRAGMRMNMHPRFNPHTSDFGRSLPGGAGWPAEPLPAVRLEPPKVFGLVELTLGQTVGMPDGAFGSPQHTLAPVKVLQGPAIDMIPLRQSTFDTVDRDGLTYRYFRATFRVRNAPACATPGRCAPYSKARHRVALVPVATTATIAGTPFARLDRRDGPPADLAQAQRLKPFFGRLDAPGSELEASAYSEPFLLGLPPTTALPGATKLFDQPFPVIVASNDRCAQHDRYTLPVIPEHAPPDDGLVTLTYGLALTGEAVATPAPDSVLVVLALVGYPATPANFVPPDRPDWPWSPSPC